MVSGATGVGNGFRWLLMNSIRSLCLGECWRRQAWKDEQFEDHNGWVRGKSGSGTIQDPPPLRRKALGANSDRARAPQAPYNTVEASKLMDEIAYLYCVSWFILVKQCWDQLRTVLDTLAEYNREFKAIMKKVGTNNVSLTVPGDNVNSWWNVIKSLYDALSLSQRLFIYQKWSDSGRGSVCCLFDDWIVTVDESRIPEIKMASQILIFIVLTNCQ